MGNEKKKCHMYITYSEEKSVSLMRGSHNSPARCTWKFISLPVKLVMPWKAYTCLSKLKINLIICSHYFNFGSRFQDIECAFGWPAEWVPASSCSRHYVPWLLRWNTLIFTKTELKMCYDDFLLKFFSWYTPVMWSREKWNYQQI